MARKKTEIDKITDGLKLTYQRMVIEKRLRNLPIVVMSEGKIVHLDPHEVEISSDK